MARQTPLQLDIKTILRRRLSRGANRLLPGVLINMLARIIRQNDLNQLLKGAFPAEGSAFSASVLDQLGISVETVGLEKLRGMSLVFACNHPLGGLDGITMVRLLGETFGDGNVKVLVNDMLMHVEPLAPVFLPVNKYGSQARESARLITSAFASESHICVFPAGLVSRLGADGEIRDLEWQKSFVAKSMESGRRIVPVRFEALNSQRFYKVARMRKRLGLKINIEQALLPSELFSQKGKRFRVVFGDPVDITPCGVRDSSPAAIAAELRRAVYSL